MTQLAQEPIFAPQRIFSPSLPIAGANPIRGRREVIFSIIGHNAILVLLILFGVKKIPPTESVQVPIYAQLYTPPPKVPELILTRSNSELSTTEQNIPVTPSIPEVTSQLTSPSTAMTEGRPQEESLTEIVESESLLEEKQERQAISRGVKKKAVKQKKVKNGLRRYFEQHNGLQQHNIATEAARVYQQQRNSPTLPTYSQQYNDGIEPALDSIKADCSSGASKAFSLLSSLTGGTVECTQRSKHYQQYIDKRLGDR